MKKHFYTGLVVTLPLFITFYVFNWLLKIVIKLISGTIITKTIRIILKTFLQIQGHNVEFQIITYLVSTGIIILFITLLGYTMKIVLFSKIMKKIGDIVEKIPVIKSVYTTAKQIIGIIYGQEGETAYRKTVAIEYPRKGIYAIGFMTSEKNNVMSKAFGKGNIANVFIPTSPNPTSGMLVCIPREDVVILDMDTEMAFKLIISGGYVTEEVIKKLENKAD